MITIQELSNQIDEPYQVSPLQAWIVKAVANRRSTEWIADQLNTYFEERGRDERFSARTVRRACKGLAGQKDKVPKKWQLNNTDKRFLSPIEKHPDNPINFSTTRDGDQLIASIQLPENLSILNKGTGFEDFGFEELEEDKVRPHKCFWREEIDRKPVEDGRFSWSERRTVLAEKGISWTEVSKENPKSEQSTTGELVYYNDVRVLLFENTIHIRYDMPVVQKPIFEVLDDWWSKRKEVVDWVESVFESVSISSSPMDVQMPLSASEWGLVKDEFAEWVDENPVFQDDSENSLFEVRNDSGEKIFHIDNSPSDEFGGDVPESEFLHSEFGAEHISNMKQAIKWLSYLEIVPEHFEASKWVFNNRDFLESVVDVEDNVEFLESKVEGLTVGVSDVRSRVEDLSFEVESLGDQVGLLSEQMQNNRDEFYEELNEQRSDLDEIRGISKDVVERVDYTRQEVDENRSRISEAKQELSNKFEADYELLREDLDSVDKKVSGLVRQNQELESNQEDIMEEVRKQRRINEEKLDELIEEHRKTLVRRVAENLRDLREIIF